MVFGTGQGAELFKHSMNDHCIIIGYLDNDQSKWGQYLDQLLIYKPDDLISLEYDYVVIASSYYQSIYNDLRRIGVSKHKIFSYIQFREINVSLIDHKYDLFINNKERYSGIITGLSYAYYGINEGDLGNGEFLNFAQPSQDLYYDYTIAQKLISDRKFKNIQHCIIGICYFSFQYDLSKSATKSKVLKYIPLLNDPHNYINYHEEYELYDIQHNIAKLILRKNNGFFVFHYANNNLESMLNKEITGKQQAIIDCNKNYPDTVLENTTILSEYLNMLNSHGVKSRLVIFPCSSYYTKHFDPDMKSEFLHIIKDLQQKYEFSFHDYFEDKRFVDSDFADHLHLNQRGSDKMTDILSNLLALD